MLIKPLLEKDAGPHYCEAFNAARGVTYTSQSFEIDHTDVWNSQIGMDPTQFFEILTMDLPGTPALKIVSRDDGLFVLKLTEENGMYSDSRSIMPCSAVLAGHMKVDLKGQGIGKTIFRNYVELGIHLNCTSFTILAGSDNGGYAWAKLGVPMDTIPFSTDVTTLQQRLGEKLSAVKHHVPTDLYLEIMDLMGFEDPHDINRIADIDLVLPVSKRDLFRACANAGQYNRDGAINALEHCEREKKPLTLGRYLLNGTCYNGYLDFFDEDVMRRVEQYVGGFKTFALLDDAPATVPTGSSPHKEVGLVPPGAG
jgi:hypothetical protein